MCRAQAASPRRGTARARPRQSPSRPLTPTWWVAESAPPHRRATARVQQPPCHSPRATGPERAVLSACTQVGFESAREDANGYAHAALMFTAQYGAFPHNTLFRLREIREPGTWTAPGGVRPRQRLLVVTATCARAHCHQMLPTTIECLRLPETGVASASARLSTVLSLSFTHPASFTARLSTPHLPSALGTAHLPYALSTALLPSAQVSAAHRGRGRRGGRTQQDERQRDHAHVRWEGRAHQGVSATS